MDGEIVDLDFMNQALRLAQFAAHNQERPFGCVIVYAGGAIASGYGTGSDLDPTRHSEIVAIREACAFLETANLSGCALYSTHEPCTMCAGAIVHAKLSRVVWGSDRDDLPMLFRTREFGGARTIFTDTTHPVEYEAHVLQRDCIKLFDAEVAEYLKTANR